MKKIMGQPKGSKHMKFGKRYQIRLGRKMDQGTGSAEGKSGKKAAKTVKAIRPHCC